MQVNKIFCSAVFFVLMSYSCFAQSELNDVQARLDDYTKKELPEKVFLHTDKNFYTAGEIVWFKAYVVDGIFHKPLPASKVAYVELLDKNNLPVYRTKIALNEKGGNGSIQLSFNLNSGYYRIRAYTNWMKNQGTNLFFEKDIAVINPLKTPETQVKKPAVSYRLQLFPEGGNLVNGISSKIAFHLTEATGKGLDGKGYLLNSANDTLSTFTPFKFGMGHFVITPQSGEVYKVNFVMNDGSTVSQVLPRSFETGYVMQLEEAADNRIKITVKTNIHPGYPEIFLLAQTRQVVKAAQKSLITDGNAVFTIDKKALGEGVSQLTVFNNERKPVCERLFFVQPTSTKQVALQTSKQNYSTREKVELAVPSSEQENLSLSVYRLDELEKGDAVNIDQYLWLTSELNGNIEQAGYYFSTYNDEVAKATDYLMLTNGWRRFKWENVFNQSPVIKFPREQFGHIVTARVVNSRTNLPAPDRQVFLSVPRSPQKLFTAISDSNGMVQFDIRNYFGQSEMVAQTNQKIDSFYRVEILSPFDENYTTHPYQVLTLSSSYQNTILDRSINMQAQNIYKADSIHKFLKPYIIDTFPFYGVPLYTYKLDDYTRFRTMEEVLREYVREINVGVKGSGNSLRFKLFNQTDRALYTDNILVLMDGIPLFDPNKIFSVDPLSIRKLDVVNENYVLGGYVFHGLANFLSYEGLYDRIEINPQAITVDYEGLQLQREFYSPDYSTTIQHNSRVPDLRTTLFWMPDVTTNKMQFYTGDNKGRYIIVLQGVDTNGKTITASSSIEVN